MIKLNSHDKKLVDHVIEEIKEAFIQAKYPSAVAKRIVVIAVRYRNRGKRQAIARHPFRNICEASGMLLLTKDKCLDELEPEKGYFGKVRWICPKANNSGLRSCGGC